MFGVAMPGVDSLALTPVLLIGVEISAVFRRREEHVMTLVTVL